jgi:hypothetical protein
MKQKIWVLIFFFIFLIAGILIFRDYGISWDESTHRETGMISFNYLFHGNKSLLDYEHRYYGVAFELPLIFFEKILKLENLRDVFFMRHLFIFLVFFGGVYFFYRICKDYFKDWRVGVIGCLSLILSPRIFADSFYNSMDIAFLSVFIISAYTLIKWIEKKSFFRIFIHAFVCAILIDIRILGVLILFFTFSVFCYDFIFGNNNWRNKLIHLFLYGILVLFFVIIFWPYLWSSPITNFEKAFYVMGHTPYNNTVLYLGNYVDASNLPWHYIPVWLILTTPLLYLVGFILGLLLLVFYFLKFRWSNYDYLQKQENIIFLLWFFIPLICIILLKSTLYDGWRHMFFIYPAFLIISIEGIIGIYKIIKGFGKKYRIFNMLLVLAIIGSLFFSFFFIAYNHPHENVYFNFLAGSPENIRNNFELDYWGLSYRTALQYILKADNRSSINIIVENIPGVYNSYLLTSSEKARLNYVTSTKNADYLLTNYRWHKNDYDYPEIYSIKVDGLKIMSIYKLK